MTAATPREMIQIRWMIRRDMDQVLAIESEAFEFPWSEEQFIWCLQTRTCLGMVAEDGDRVLGFMVYELTKTHIQILNFAVATNCRRRGVGRTMIAKLARKLEAKMLRQSRVGLACDVRETNLGAQLFFRACGFRATKIVRSPYKDTGEDAYTMVLHRSQPTLYHVTESIEHSNSKGMLK